MSRPRRRGRDVHGVFLLDKQQGASSNDVLQKVKRLFNANKAGHTGALDPLATGMLPICLGERTDTSDADGNIVETRPVTFSQSELDAALESFRGETMQVPTMFSALKYQGRKLYEYAREGVTVPREARPITVFELQFIRWEGDELELEIHVSKGTYIRTIIDDLGEKLGCGAHVIMLRRLQVARYPIEKMMTLEQLQAVAATVNAAETPDYAPLDALLLPMDSPAEAFPRVNLPSAVAAFFKQGMPVQAADAPQQGLVRVTEGDAHKFIGMAEIADDGRVAPRRLVVEYPA